eukprot:1097101-Pleurochrysis_carterae.AAC.3
MVSLGCALISSRLAAHCIHSRKDARDVHLPDEMLRLCENTGHLGDYAKIIVQMVPPLKRRVKHSALKTYREHYRTLLHLVQRSAVQRLPALHELSARHAQALRTISYCMHPFLQPHVFHKHCLFWL